jgi:hypothetical protein
VQSERERQKRRRGEERRREKKRGEGKVRRGMGDRVQDNSILSRSKLKGKLLVRFQNNLSPFMMRK